MRIDTQAENTNRADAAPRLRRSAAVVIAQYIQDLTHPREPEPCTPIA
jgi:hypothetical protein